MEQSVLRTWVSYSYGYDNNIRITWLWRTGTLYCQPDNNGCQSARFIVDPTRVQWHYHVDFIIMDSYYRAVTWVLRLIKAPATQPSIQQLVRANIKEINKAPHYWPFVMWIHRWPSSCHEMSSWSVCFSFLSLQWQVAFMVRLITDGGRSNVTQAARVRQEYMGRGIYTSLVNYSHREIMRRYVNDSLD